MAVDVPAAFSEIPFRAEVIFTAARQAHGDASEVDASSVSWPVAESDRRVSHFSDLAAVAIYRGRQDRRDFAHSAAAE